jgi:hypothetical protein
MPGIFSALYLRKISEGTAPLLYSLSAPSSGERLLVSTAEPGVREVWSDVARCWYQNAAGNSPNSGSIQHHIAITARPSIVEELFHYSKALASVVPFTPGGSLSSVSARAFVEAQALLLMQGSLLLFDKMIGVFISGIDTSCERDLFQLQGPKMACILFTALLDFHNPGAFLWNVLLEDQSEPQCNTSRSTAFFFLACSYSSRTPMFSKSTAAVATQQWGTLESASVTSRTPLILAQLLNSRIPTAFSPAACEISPDKDVSTPLEV